MLAIIQDKPVQFIIAYFYILQYKISQLIMCEYITWGLCWVYEFFESCSNENYIIQLCMLSYMYHEN